MTSSMSMLARELNSAYDFSRSSSSPMPWVRTRLTYSRAALTGASSGDTVAMSWLSFDAAVDVLEVMSSIPSTRSHIASKVSSTVVSSRLRDGSKTTLPSMTSRRISKNGRGLCPVSRSFSRS